MCVPAFFFSYMGLGKRCPCLQALLTGFAKSPAYNRILFSQPRGTVNLHRLSCFLLFVKHFELACNKHMKYKENCHCHSHYVVNTALGEKRGKLIDLKAWGEWVRGAAEEKPCVHNI